MACAFLIVSSQITTRIKVAADGQTEIWFYHLEHAPLERVLPELLEKTLAKGWRAQVRVGSQERLDALNTHLWTYRPESFLPHGTVTEGRAPDQPISLTLEEANINQANALFLVDSAPPGDVSRYERCITIFDGKDDEALRAARDFWKQASEQGRDVTYWRQADHGKWEKKT